MFVKRPFSYKYDKKLTVLQPGVEFDFNSIPEFAQKMLQQGNYLSADETAQQKPLASTVRKTLPVKDESTGEVAESFSIKQSPRATNKEKIHNQAVAIQEAKEIKSQADLAEAIKKEKKILPVVEQETVSVIKEEKKESDSEVITEVPSEPAKVVVNPNPKPRPQGKRKI